MLWTRQLQSLCIILICALCVSSFEVVPFDHLTKTFQNGYTAIHKVGAMCVAPHAQYTSNPVIDKLDSTMFPIVQQALQPCIDYFTRESNDYDDHITTPPFFANGAEQLFRDPAITMIPISVLPSTLLSPLLSPFSVMQVYLTSYAPFEVIVVEKFSNVFAIQTHIETCTTFTPFPRNRYSHSARGYRSSASRSPQLEPFLEWTEYLNTHEDIFPYQCTLDLSLYGYFSPLSRLYIALRATPSTSTVQLKVKATRSFRSFTDTISDTIQQAPISSQKWLNWFWTSQQEELPHQLSPETNTEATAGGDPTDALDIPSSKPFHHASPATVIQGFENAVPSDHFPIFITFKSSSSTIELIFCIISLILFLYLPSLMRKRWIYIGMGAFLGGFSIMVALGYILLRFVPMRKTTLSLAVVVNYFVPVPKLLLAYTIGLIQERPAEFFVLTLFGAICGAIVSYCIKPDQQMEFTSVVIFFSRVFCIFVLFSLTYNAFSIVIGLLLFLVYSLMMHPTTQQMKEGQFYSPSHHNHTYGDDHRQSYLHDAHVDWDDSDQYPPDHRYHQQQSGAMKQSHPSRSFSHRTSYDPTGSRSASKQHQQWLDGDMDQRLDQELERIQSSSKYNHPRQPSSRTRQSHAYTEDTFSNPEEEPQSSFLNQRRSHRQRVSLDQEAPLPSSASKGRRSTVYQDDTSPDRQEVIRAAPRRSARHRT